MPDGAGMAPSNNEPRNELSDSLAPSGMPNAYEPDTREARSANPAPCLQGEVPRAFSEGR